MRLAILAAGLAATAAILSSGTARADDPSPSGIEIGLRSGYAIPLGSIASGDDLSKGISGAIPIWFDAGYRLLNPNLFLGAYLQYGIGFLPSTAGSSCGQNGVSCSVNLLMYGVQAHFHFAPHQAVDPWLGVAFGFENLIAGVSEGTVSGSATDSGLDYVTFMVGADYKPSPNVGVGPFVNFALGQYSDASVSGPGNSQSGSIQNPALHEWLMLGIRVTDDVNL